MDMTKVWIAQHGWVYLHVIVDCCTREVTGWRLDLRTRPERSDRLCRAGDHHQGGPRRGAHARHRQRQPVHLAGLPPPPLRARRHASARRLPRPRVPGVHRVLVRAVQEAMRLESRVGNPRPGQKGDQRLHRPLPPPAPLRAGLPDTRRGRRDLARHARPTQRSDLNRQRERGPHSHGPCSLRTVVRIRTEGR